MKKRYKFALSLIGVVAAGVAFGFWYISTADSREPSLVLYSENCASCHGGALEGTADGPSLVAAELKHGETVPELIAAIILATPEAPNHAWGDNLNRPQIKSLAILISERRQNYPTTLNSYAMVPSEEQRVESQLHDFALQRVAELRSRPYALAPLPDGRILVSEKVGGLSIVSTAGVQEAALEGTPRIRDMALSVGGAWMTLGSLLDVELHPDYAGNGWIYLSHADRCDWWCGWFVPGTMVRVVRGRIIAGKWVDQEVIWSVHSDHYTPVPDAVAAGRLAFDRKGFLYLTVGGKNAYGKLHDLNTPYGKVHRVHDDGRVPSDNPFWIPEAERRENSTIHTVWSYGHRTGQGLDGHPGSGAIFNSEMGPRGGDEINRILPGQNYGWPLYTNGLDYDGDDVAIGVDLGLDFAIEDTILPAVDFTPAPAVSNFTFHRGERFFRWEDDILLGTLKEGALYRVRLRDEQTPEIEKLVSGFGRMRDVAMGFDGLVYVALEHQDRGSIWRLVPLEGSSETR